MSFCYIIHIHIRALVSLLWNWQLSSCSCMVCTANFIVAKLASCVVCSCCAPVCLCYYEDHVPTSPNFNCVKSHLFRAVIRFMKYEPAVIVRFHLCVCFHFATQFFKYKSVIVAWLSDWFPEVIQLLEISSAWAFVHARHHCWLMPALIVIWESTHTTGHCSWSSFIVVWYVFLSNSHCR